MTGKGIGKVAVVGFASLGLMMFFSQRTESQATIVRLDWTPPKTDLPESLVTATKDLLGNGLSDPRGGTFSKVVVEVGDAAWSGLAKHEVYGWLLPGGKKVVLLDGLTYDVISTSGAAQFSDIYRERKPAAGGMNFSAKSFPRTNMAVPITSPSLATVSLLLVRGETKLAEEVFKPYKNAVFTPALTLFIHFLDRYRMQVGQCMMVRRDKEALGYAQKLAVVSELRVRRGHDYPPGMVSWELDAREPKLLLKDAERRVAHPKQPIDLQSLAKLDQKTRIQILLENLDETGAKQWGQPGGIDWNQDAITNAIIKEGEAAVPALLDHIETDERFTRSVSFGRDFAPGRTIQTVRAAAWSCLSIIWPTARTTKTGTQKEIVTELRALWTKSAKLSGQERWLNIFRDDSGGPRNWLSAGKTLVARNSYGNPSSYPTIGDIRKVPLYGEPLRQKYGKEIDDLYERRIAKMASLEPLKDTSQIYAMSEGMDLAHAYFQWNPAKAMAQLRLVSENALKMRDQWKTHGEYAEEILARPFANIIADRVRSGDPTAASDFEAVMALTAKRGPAAESFKPLWTVPDDPSIQKVGEHVFAKILSHLQSSNRSEAGQYMYAISGYLRVPLLKSPAFRTFLARAINSKGYVGQMWVTSNQSQSTLAYSIGVGGSGSMGLPAGTSVAGISAEKVSITLGDYCAQMATAVKACPPFLGVWPEARRASARRQQIAWLESSEIDWGSVSKSPFYFERD